MKLFWTGIAFMICMLAFSVGRWSVGEPDKVTMESATVTLNGLEWFCAAARVESLELPLTVACYEYRRKEAQRAKEGK